VASPSTVITLGYGTFGSVNLLPTVGYGSSAAVAGVAGPFCFHEGLAFSPGGTDGLTFSPGGSEGLPYVAGGSEGIAACNQ
jgi:hypothetical protein